MNAITHLNEVKVSYKSTTATETIRTSNEAQELCRKAFEMANAEISLKEHFFVLYFNRANKLIGYYLLSSGGLTGTIADIRIAFAIGLKCLATSIVAVHSHPSGNASPSDSDVELTRKFKKTGELLDIRLLDHIILTEDSYYSFSDNGLL